jgi:hypothetical protein
MGRGERAGGRTRAEALRAALAGSAVLGAGGLVGTRIRSGAAAAEPSPRQDAEVLDFLLTLEVLQESLYREAVRHGGLGEDLLAFARRAGEHETRHVAALSALLERPARRRSAPDLRPATASPEAFRAAAIELEEAAIAAYIAQGANLTTKAVGQAARIVAVEARHAAWIRDLAGEDPAPRAADPPRDADDILARLRERGLAR